MIPADTAMLVAGLSFCMGCIMTAFAVWVMNAIDRAVNRYCERLERSTGDKP